MFNGSSGERRQCHPGRGKWKKIRWILLICFLSQCSNPVQIGQKAPGFTLQDLTGRSVSLQDLSGKVVLLHFWATWCPPCLTELPALIRFSKGLNPDKFALLAVCVDDTGPEAVGAFLESWGFEIPALLDKGGRLARKYGTYRYPETYILDREGFLQKKIVGAGDWNSPKWVQFLHDSVQAN